MFKYKPQAFYNFPIGNGQIPMAFDIDFDHIAMLEIGVNMDGDAAQGGSKTLFSFTGIDTANKPEKEVLSCIISDDKSAILISVLGQEALIKTDQFSSGEFYHLSFYFYHDSHQISLRINGDKDIVFQPVHDKHPNFKLHSLYIGQDSSGKNRLSGKISCFRLWNAFIYGKSLNALAEWENPDIPPYKENGFEAIPNTEELLVANLKLSRPELIINDHSTFLLGCWVNSQTEFYGGKLVPLEIKNVKASDHCVYQEQRYLSIVNHQNRKHLITDRGIILPLEKRTKEYFLFKGEDPSIFCKIQEIRKDLVNTIDQTNNEQKIHIKEIKVLESQNLELPNGKYNIPKKEELAEEGTTFGNIFLHRLPKLKQMYQGVDLTLIDIFNPASKAELKAPIFRFPSNGSRGVKVIDGVAVPFGILYNPHSEFEETTQSTFITSKASMESASQEGRTWKKTSNTGGSAGVNIPGEGSGNASLNLGFSNEFNRSQSNKLSELNERQEFMSISRWKSLVHDLVLNKHSLLLDGQFSPYDNPSSISSKDEDQSARFYTDLLLLKDGSSKDYESFIDKYGTHFVESASYGAKGELRHTFNQDIVQKLLATGSQVEHKEGFSYSLNESIGLLGMFDFGMSEQKSTEEGKSKSESLSSEVLNLTKKEDTIERAYGVSSDGKSPDPSGAIQVNRHFSPITDLLAPPIINDLELIKEVRLKLREAINEYHRKRMGEGWIEEPYYLAIHMTPFIPQHSHRIVIDLENNTKLNDIFNSLPTLMDRRRLLVNKPNSRELLRPKAILEYMVLTEKQQDKGWGFTKKVNKPNELLRYANIIKHCKILRYIDKSKIATVTLKARLRLCFEGDFEEKNIGTENSFSHYTPYEKFEIDLNRLKFSFRDGRPETSTNAYNLNAEGEVILVNNRNDLFDIAGVPCNIVFTKMPFDQFIAQ